jgi:hypothetical protein
LIFFFSRREGKGRKEQTRGFVCGSLKNFFSKRKPQKVQASDFFEIKKREVIIKHRKNKGKKAK